MEFLYKIKRELISTLSKGSDDLKPKAAISPR